ncbi:TetR family transcriptional regulator [Nocardioides mangrovi]|uniref:TetR/AcrR family transcriptional regulator n=1 Tax=Nocardioides mangrovi TaxID=2874580 RepID=A0ABS7UHZ7_9ACTN|nr:TetR family transcriptional regulator [Nocardioides mangrovi]MBZ5740658.1 TetR/AcrR family transcriptional regulator [Nocardioides mangrovi]
MTSTPASGLRSMTRDAVRAQIAAVAIDLFAEHGFDQVTVEQIATASGISARSFHRYFPAKEDAVIGDTTVWAELVRDTLDQRPTDESPWESLRAAFGELLARSDGDRDRQRRTMRVLSSTPSLRARNLEKHLMWARMFAPIVEERLDGDHVELRAQALVQSALVCFDLALTTWADSQDDTSPVDYLALAFATVGPR